MYHLCFLCDNVGNLIIGIISSIMASIIVLSYTKIRDKRADKNKYGGAAGEYIGYGGIDGGDTINEETPISKAEITYIGGNQLKLRLTENIPNEWEGLISMDSNNYGTIVWRYTILHGKPVESTKHRFGLKRFMFYPRGNQKVAYLIGEKGFGNEILIEASKK